MPKDSIYLISDGGELQRIEHSLYATEDILQQLIAKYPEVLASDQIDPESPPRWLLLQREAAIPDAAGAMDRWSLDHLLLDQFGVPTFVEVKRSTDSRIRREVIGQMLDYIANAQAYWAAGRMRQMLVEEAGTAEIADARMVDHLGLDVEPDIATQQIERFWQQVDTNLREGNVRLLFVADELPRELRRLIEFLNAQFTRIEVLGVELRQYVGQGLRALVPRIIGQTESVRERKELSSSSPRPSAPASATNQETFLAACPPSTHHLFSTIITRAPELGYDIRWGTRGFTCRLKRQNQGPITILYCYPPGVSARNDAATVEAYSKHMETPTARERLMSLFEALPGFRRISPLTVRCALTPDAQINADQILKAMAVCANELFPSLQS